MKQRGEGTLFDFRALLEKQNRTRLAVVLGGAAMLLLLLSELLPSYICQPIYILLSLVYDHLLL